MNRIILFAILCFVHQLAIAGGDYFPIEVISVSIEKDENNSFVLIAKPIVKERQWMDKECTKITVNGIYDKVKWKNYQRPMSLESHIKSLSVLQDSSTQKKKVYFGFIGAGLYEKGKCLYLSKGLFLENGKVFSVYTKI